MNRCNLALSGILCLALLSSCSTTPKAGRQSEDRDFQPAKDAVVRSEEQAGDANADEANGPRSVVEVVEGTGVFYDSEAARRLPEVDAGDGEIIFNFEGESLQEVVKAILGDFLQLNYVIAPGVQGSVTFSTAKPVPADDVMSILEMLLSWNNASMVYIDGRYHVIPTERAIRGQLRPVIGDGADQRGYEVRAFPLEFIAPTEMEKLLQPYAKQNAIINVDNSRGLLVLAGTRRELQLYEQTIEIFDVDWLEGMSVGIYPLDRVEADTVVAELESVFGEGSGTPLAGMFRFMPIERLNAVLVITPQSQYLEKAVEWVKRLDRGGSEAGARLYVYDVKNVKATDLASTLSEVFGGASSGSRENRNRGRSNQLAPGLEAGEITSINDPRREQEQSNTTTSVSRGGSDSEAGLALVDGEEIKITAVEESNALLIRATAPQYDAVLGAIKRLDVIPLQVLVEAKVLEVTLSESLQYGVEWFFENGVNSGSFDLNPPTDTGSGAKGLFGSGRSVSEDRSGLINSGGGRYAILGSDVGAIITALESQTDVRTISAPTMMVMNNKQATITVGTQIPVNSPIFNTGTGSNIGQSRVQFRDTGTTLDVTPRVNPGGMVFMEISQEVSFPIGSADSNGNVSVSQRRVNTEVAVQSGETVVLGGLISTRLDRPSGGLPFLHRIPIVGGLFGNKSRSEERTELLVLITPKVVNSVDEAREVSNEYKRKMKGLRPINIETIEIDN